MSIEKEVQPEEEPASTTGGKLKVSVASTFPTHISVAPPARPAVYTTGTTPTFYPQEDEAEAEEAREKAEREAELVVLPTRRPRKILVAFFDDEDEEANHEPFWAAFLEPKDMDLFLSPKDARDAQMSLSLALRKRFSQ